MKRWIPTREKILRTPGISAVAHYLHDERLWHIDRSCVARAVAIGLFFGLLLPVAQFAFAIVTAIWLRGHVAIAAASTLVTNPFTFAPIYWLAYRIGHPLLGTSVAEVPPTDPAILERQAESTALGPGWLTAMWETLQTFGAPLLLGLAVLAVVASATGYALVWFLWKHEKEKDQPGNDS